MKIALPFWLLWHGMLAWITGQPLLDQVVRARETAAEVGQLPGSPQAPSATMAIVRRVHTSEPAVVLTFDACATQTQANGFDPRILAVLEREQVPATIFVSGRWVETHPDAMQALAADPLIEFGNHTYDHPHMTWLDDAQLKEEITRTSALLDQYGRRAVAFRPPFGDIDAHVVEVVARAGLPTVTWDVVSGDPSRRATTASIVASVLDRARSGSIIIFHINGRAPYTADALPIILLALRSKGFTFVALSSFLHRPPAEAAP